MITDQIGLHWVLLPLLIVITKVALAFVYFYWSKTIEHYCMNLNFCITFLCPWGGCCGDFRPYISHFREWGSSFYLKTYDQAIASNNSKKTMLTMSQVQQMWKVDKLSLLTNNQQGEWHIGLSSEEYPLHQCKIQWLNIDRKCTTINQSFKIK